MKTANKQLTWQELANRLGLSVRYIHALRRGGEAPTSRDPDEWRSWLDNREQTHIKDGSTIAELKSRLIEEQTRKEAALASLRELELKMKVESLVPESDLIARLKETLIPLRRLLDAMPRGVSNLANPKEPNVAEVAIRKYLDQRVFSEMVRIMDELNEED